MDHAKNDSLFLTFTIFFVGLGEEICAGFVAITLLNSDLVLSMTFKQVVVLDFSTCMKYFGRISSKMFLFFELCNASAKQIFSIYSIFELELHTFFSCSCTVYFSLKLIFWSYYEWEKWVSGIECIFRMKDDILVRKYFAFFAFHMANEERNEEPFLFKKIYRLDSRKILLDSNCYYDC